MVFIHTLAWFLLRSPFPDFALLILSTVRAHADCRNLNSHYSVHWTHLNRFPVLSGVKLGVRLGII